MNERTHHLLAQLEAVENSLADSLKAKQQEVWLAQHQQAIAAYNQQVDESGAFGDAFRAF